MTGYAVTTAAPVQQTLPNISAHNLVYRSKDGGGTWRRVSAVPGSQSATILSITVSPTGPDDVLIAELDSSMAVVWHSIDGGASWSQAQNSTDFGWFTIGTVFDAANPQIAYSASSTLVGNGSDFQVSRDGGNSFTRGNGIAWPLLSLRSGAGSVLFGALAAFNGNGLVRSYDQGTTQQRLSLPPLDPTEDFFALTADPNDSNTIFALTALNYPPGTAQTSACRLLKTTDGGNSWAFVATQGGVIATNCGPESLSVDPANSAHLVVAQGYGVVTTPPVLESFDGGITWRASAAGLLSLYGWQLAPQPATSNHGNVLWTATPQGAFKSLDNGSTWTSSSTGMVFPGVAQIIGEPMPSTRLYAATQGGVFTADFVQGQGWTSISAGLASLNVTGLALDWTRKPHALYAATDNGLFVSYDNAQFVPVTAPAASNSYTGVFADPHTANNLYILGAPNAMTGAGKDAWATRDGGRTWNPLPFNDQSYTVGILPDPGTPGSVYAWSFSQLDRSTDGGQTFSALPIPNGDFTNRFAILPRHGTVPERIVGVCNYNFCLSPDNGVSWQTTGPVPDRFAYSAAISGDPRGIDLFYGSNLPAYPITAQESNNVGLSFARAQRGLPNAYAGFWISQDNILATSLENGAVFIRPIHPAK